jgi:Family of unknown function (DUF6291)
VFFVSEDKKGFVLYKDWCLTVLEWTEDVEDPLTDSEFAALMKCVFRYQSLGEDTSNSLPRNVRFAFKSLLDVFNRDSEKWQKTRERRRESGRMGGLAKSNKANFSLSEDPVIEEPKKPKKEKPVKSVTQFDDFYLSYPKKVAERNALKAYENALKLTTHDTIMESLERYKKQIQSNKTEPRFIAMPATWLNGRRWNDKETTVVVTAQKPSDYYDTSKNKHFIDNGDYTDYSKKEATHV